MTDHRSVGISVSFNGLNSIKDVGQNKYLIDYDQATECLSQENWETFFNAPNVNAAFESFLGTMVESINRPKTLTSGNNIKLKTKAMDDELTIECH